MVIKFCCQTTTDSHAGQQEDTETRRRVLVPVSVTAYLTLLLAGKWLCKAQFPSTIENWCAPFLRTVAYAVLLPKRANGTVAWRLIWRFYFFSRAYQVTCKVLLEGP